MADVELVIRIDEIDYRAIKNKKVIGDLTIPNVFDAIRNGTLHTKGHDSLINVKDVGVIYEKLHTSIELLDEYIRLTNSESAILNSISGQFKEILSSVENLACSDSGVK